MMTEDKSDIEGETGQSVLEAFVGVVAQRPLRGAKRAKVFKRKPRRQNMKPRVYSDPAKNEKKKRGRLDLQRMYSARGTKAIMTRWRGKVTRHMRLVVAMTPGAWHRSRDIRLPGVPNPAEVATALVKLERDRPGMIERREVPAAKAFGRAWVREYRLTRKGELWRDEVQMLF